MSEWISVEERLPDLNEQVFVIGQIGDTLTPVRNSDGTVTYRKPIKIWITKRIDGDRFNDGNGFLRIYPHGGDEITHWFPIPKLNGESTFLVLK